jgi:NAD+ kinase
MIQRIGIINKMADTAALEATCFLARWLVQQGCRATVTTEAATAGGLSPSSQLRVTSQDQLAQEQEFIVVIGGDGTFIAAARTLEHRPVPIMGINMGRLGFLTEVPGSAMCDAMTHVIAGEYTIEERMMLQVMVQRGTQVVLQGHVLNDVVVHKGALGRMIECDVSIDGHSVFSSRADGLLVATPTGSTGYALSCGGPIIHPSIDVMVLVAVCPHTLTSRPIVVPGASDILITVDINSMERLITLDGQQGFALHQEDAIRVYRSPHRLHVAHPPKRDYYDILRNRLRWGEGVGIPAAGNGARRALS